MCFICRFVKCKGLDVLNQWLLQALAANSLPNREGETHELVMAILNVLHVIPTTPGAIQRSQLSITVATLKSDECEFFSEQAERIIDKWSSMADKLDRGIKSRSVAVQLAAKSTETVWECGVCVSEGWEVCECGGSGG